MMMINLIELKSYCEVESIKNWKRGSNKHLEKPVRLQPTNKSLENS